VESVLDACQKSAVVLVSKGSFAPFALGSETQEFDVVIGDVVTLLHVEMLELRLSFSNRVMGSKVDTKLTNKVWPVHNP
jgi:hypothetical protein